MVRLSLRIALLSLVTLALAAPAFAYNVVNTAWTVQCLFSTTCSVTVTDYGADFPVSGGSGNGHLQSRIYQGQPGSAAAGKWIYEYRINMTQVAGLTYPPYADQLAIYNWGTLRQYDYNSDSIATDQVFNITSGGIGTKAVTSAFLSGSWSYFTLNDPVYSGSYPGGGESSYFFGMVSDQAPVLRTVYVHLDSGWVSMTGYAPPLP
ncbi:MAG TPA: hypothetical protein VGQ46_20350 [Thermoanaerobaculia bacterium]|jgi:hypothetical protein|nr:hypothetical protein [Thermoanaerobaculia bacterium]